MRGEEIHILQHLRHYLEKVAGTIILWSVFASCAWAGNTTVIMGVDPLAIPEWPSSISAMPSKLLLSDSPETVAADGVLYQDTVNGAARVFFHHVNGTTAPKRFVVLLANAGTQEVIVTVHQHGVAGPGWDYLDVGKTAQERYFNGNGIYFVAVPPHGTALLDSALAEMKVTQGALVNGIYDFTADGPVQVRVLALPAAGDINALAAKATVLPPDQYRLRGTFDGADRLVLPSRVYTPQENRAVVLTLADDERDKYVSGKDATTGQTVVNYGDYGVYYRIFWPSDGRGNMAVYLNPRGGQYAGALQVKYRATENKVILTPDDRVSLDDPSQAARLGTYAAGESLWFGFMPPGASNLPVKLVVIAQ